MTHKFSTDATEIACGMLVLLLCAIRDHLREHHDRPLGFVLHQQSWTTLRDEAIAKPGLAKGLKWVDQNPSFQGIPIHVCQCRGLNDGHFDSFVTVTNRQEML